MIFLFFFFSSRRRHTRFSRDWSSDVCSSDLFREEQVYFITEGAGELRYGEQKVSVRRNDFMYLPAGIGHGLSNSGGVALRAIVMGFKLTADAPAGDRSSKALVANTDDVKLQVVGGHPPSTLYQL